jgi:hypothetical protein
MNKIISITLLPGIKTGSFMLLSLMMLVSGGCKKDSLCNCLNSTGAVSSEERLLSPFTSVEMDQNVDVIYRFGNSYSAKVTCGRNLIDGIRTDVENGRLYIGNNNKCNWLRDFKNKFTVEITSPQLFFITSRGSGDFNCVDTIRGPELQIDSWNGTGVLNLVVDCDEVRFKLHTGPADIMASGKAGITYIYTAGNGFVKAAAMISDYTYVTTRSTGDTEVYAKVELGVTIEYHGNVYYKGNPHAITSNITGSGQLISF